ncbi:phosphoserine phosphatase [Granulicella arctica]|uniref:phosphoserine phosphatase n=2 Tax=Granulicella arctica TaxID=940613 RepID=A0A7Y9PJ13_9BACT|nr:phosphoserine phosphatase [Granulicella arctica]
MKDAMQIGAIAAMGCLTPADAAVQTATTSSVGMLDPGRWEPSARFRIESIIRKSALEEAEQRFHRPYAVFDWDNTSIVNDTEEALLLYQIETLAFHIPSDKFIEVILQNVPSSTASAIPNERGKFSTFHSLAVDVSADYTALKQRFASLPPAPDELQASPRFHSFRAKLLFLYSALDETLGPNVAYPWVINLLSGYTLDGLARLAEESNDTALGDALQLAVFRSPEDAPGAAGPVKVEHRRGIRITSEIASTMHTLRANGFDVYVVSASLEPVVAVFASLPKYGYGIPREHVFGLRMEEVNGTLQPYYRRNWPLVWGPGKVQLIREQMISAKGYGPTLVFGDSDGDFEMLSQFPDTATGIIVNRLKSGKIGSLCRKAVEQSSKSGARFLLQGRNESTGLWRPEQTTLDLHVTQAKLLADKT